MSIFLINLSKNSSLFILFLLWLIFEECVILEKEVGNQFLGVYICLIVLLDIDIL